MNMNIGANREELGSLVTQIFWKLPSPKKMKNYASERNKNFHYYFDRVSLPWAPSPGWLFAIMNTKYFDIIWHYETNFLTFSKYYHFPTLFSLRLYMSNDTNLIRWSAISCSTFLEQVLLNNMWQGLNATEFQSTKKYLKNRIIKRKFRWYEKSDCSSDGNVNFLNTVLKKKYIIINIDSV